MLYALSWLVRGVLELSNLVLDTDFLGDSTAWSSVAYGAFLGVGAVGGLVWLAGEVLAGYREAESGGG